MPLVPRFFSSPYGLPAWPFRVETADAVSIAGHRLGSGDTALVFVHGFLGWHEKTRLVRFQEELARWFSVYALDLRGHGASGGSSRLGAIEHLDVEAVVGLARREGQPGVVTFGGSMGGIAVARHAAELGGVQGVVAVSTPARWSGHEESDAIRRMTWLSTTRAGRATLRAAGFRLDGRWAHAEEPLGFIHRISPIPLILIHGRDDHFFGPQDAIDLFEAAGEPKRLLLFDRFGHAEDGYTPALAGRIREALTGLAVSG